MPYCILTLSFLTLNTVWGKYLSFLCKTEGHVEERASLVRVYGQWWQACALSCFTGCYAALEEVELQQSETM